VTAFLREFRWLEPVVDLLRLAAFAGVVALGLLTAWRLRRGAVNPRMVDPFLLYVLAISTAVGLVQIESWPFTTWALIHNISPKQVRTWEIVGLDAAGRGYAIDPRVLQPMAPEEFGAWLFSRFGQLAPPAQTSVARFVIERAESGRQRVRRGEPVAVNDRLLGPLSAPYHFQPPLVWRSPADVPATPFVGLQLWVLQWNVEERFTDARRVSRQLLFELRDGVAG
jgi:hypothetical protein